MYPSCSPIKVSGIVLVALLHGCALLTPGPTDDTSVSDGNTTTIPVGTGSTTTYPPVIDTTTTMPTYHTVIQGETLFGIAQRYAQTWQQIAQWNNIQAPYNLNPGQQLLVSMGGGFTPSPTTTYPVDNTQTTSPVVIVDNGGLTSTPGIIDTQIGYYTVQAGDTLYSLSRRFGYSVAQLTSWNGLTPPYTLSVGQALVVSPPDGNSTSVVTTPVNTVPNMPVISTPAINYGSNVHTVQVGDTLYSLSRRYGYSVAEIASWNGLAPPYSLSVGQSLIISPSGSGSGTMVSTPSTTPSRNSSYHVVASGETLYSIAHRYGSSVAEIASLNGLAPPYTLSVGQSILVASSGSVRSASVEGGSALQLQSYNAASNNNSARNSISIHTVQKNETLASIARQYGLTTHELSIWNGIGMPYTVYPGQRLLIVPP